MRGRCARSARLWKPEPASRGAKLSGVHSSPRVAQVVWMTRINAIASGGFFAAAGVLLSVYAQQGREDRHDRGAEEQAERAVGFEAAENSQEQRYRREASAVLHRQRLDEIVDDGERYRTPYEQAHCRRPARREAQVDHRGYPDQRGAADWHQSRRR